MSMSDSLLSQAEIDRLLNGGGSEDDDRAAQTRDDGIKPYDPNKQRRVIRERLQSLEMINERFARQFRMGLFNLLRRSLDITVGAITLQPYLEFARNLPVPTNLNLVHLHPLRGSALFVFSPSLVFMAVDNLFGGDGRFPTKADGREFTPTEQRVISRLLNMALSGYESAWSTLFNIKTEYIRTEMQVKFTNITSSPNDIVVTTPFHVEIGSLHGSFDICIPFSMIEPLRELLTNPPLDNSVMEDAQWRTLLASQVRESALELVVNMAEIPTRLSAVMNMQVGDVIPFERRNSVEASVDNVPVFSARYGCIEQHYALQIEQMLNSRFTVLNKG